MPRSRLNLGLAALLAALSMVSPFSIDTFFPSFPAIAAEFALSDWQIQQTLTLYMVPFAVMALVQGPLSDALGRRPIILGGLSIYTAASVACTLAPNFASLLLFRVAQGMSAGAGAIVGRAIVRDLYDGAQAQRLLSMIMMIFGLAPAVAPVIGGWIHVTLGWRSVFGFMALIGVALLLVSWLRLPETHPEDERTPLDLAGLVRTLRSIVANREFLLLALAAGVNFVSMMVYIGAAPTVVLEHWHLRETQFAWLFLPIIVGFTTGAWLSGRLAGRIAEDRQCRAGFTLTLTASTLMVVLHAALESPPVPVQQILIATGGLGVQLIMPVLSLRMLDLFPRARGSAASIQSSVMIMLAAASFGMIVPVLNDSMLMLALGSLATATLAFGLWQLARRMAS